MSKATDDSSVSPEQAPTDLLTRLAARLEDLGGTFVELLRAPRAFWFINVFFMIDSMAYFGMLTLMETYIQKDLGTGDWLASVIVGLFTGCVTVFMIGIGELAEKRGVRRGLLIAALLCLVGRAAYAHAPFAGLEPWRHMSILFFGLLLIALGEGIIQPVAYAGIKLYTNEKNSSVGYGLIYGLMNLGIVLIGYLSPLVRVPVDKIHEAKAAGIPIPPTLWQFFADRGISGVNAVNWVCVAITAVGFVFFLVCMTKRAEAATVRGPDSVEAARQAALAAQTPWYDRIIDWMLSAVREGPFGNVRFLFFIFMLLPVQTLFAHQWLTLPAYVLRAYSQAVADKMEWIVNWVNPGIIFFGAPIIAAMTRRINVYTLMIVGSAVSALSTFVLCSGPNFYMLMVYLIVFSIGEALWQPRFLQYAAELAPEGKVAQYMGLANVPWFLAKTTTGPYSGYLLARYCPEHGPQDTTTLWLIYGIIAIISPIGLLIGRNWVMRGSHRALHSK